jgi:hypothetical protein
VTFNSNAYFTGTNFNNIIKFKDVKFTNDADFTHAKFNTTPGSSPQIQISRVNFGNLTINWNQLPSPLPWIKKSIIITSADPLSKVFKNLETQFRKHNKLQDANNASYYMKIAELEEERARGEFSWRRLFLELEWLLWGFLCGYGKKYTPILITSGVIFLLFTLIYNFCGKFSKRVFSDAKADSSFRLRLFNSPKIYYTEQMQLNIFESNHNWLKQFWYASLMSFVILFKVGYKDTTISGTIGNWNLRKIVWLEWIVGFFLLIALLVTLKNKSAFFSMLMALIF